jgi:heparan-alpha-glucosaminide N-acetyltransferase
MTISTNATATIDPLPVPGNPGRIRSIDAVRGLVVCTMIFVNYLAGAPKEIVPWWMRHFPADGNGMTFVDLVFPAFLFIVGMSIPVALGGRQRRGEPVWKTVIHVVLRTLSLLLIGILMVNGSPDSGRMGWSGTLWSILMFGSAILAFCSLSPAGRLNGARSGHIYRILSAILRVIGFVALGFLVAAYQGRDGHRIVTLSPFSIHTSWYGILGLIGWAYLVASIVFLLFRTHRTAILGCVVLLMCLYPADRAGLFDSFWLNRIVGIGSTLGSQAAITVAGLLLATILVTGESATARSRTAFALLFAAGFAAAAILLYGLYGINKNAATPSWCLWACAITAAIWLVLYWLCDCWPVGFIARPLSVAGGNVLLAYLISEMLPSVLDLLHLDDWFGRLGQTNPTCAIGIPAGFAAAILLVTALLNRAGFRLKL